MRALIIGYGWLGLPLADHLRSLHYEVCGTTRNSNKQQSLTTQDYHVHLYDLFLSPAEQQLDKTTIEDRSVVINIAPGRETFIRENYQEAMIGLIDHLIACNAEHITFVSTTSVFGQKSGRFCEQSPPAPITESGKAHAFIESYLLQQNTLKTTVLRLAGLIGPNRDTTLRHPVHSLVKRTSIENGQQVVNLVHQSDAVCLISAIIEQQTDKQIFHGCAIDHPSREHYYSWASEHLGLGKMDFVKGASSENDDIGKIIDATQTIQILGVELKYPSPFDML